MATVGNLFVNIRGDSSHLDRTVKESRSKLKGFKAFASSFSATREAQKARSRVDAFDRQKRRESFGSLIRSPAEQRQRAGLVAKATKASSAADIAKMRLFTAAAFSTIGVSAAVAGTLIREAASTQRETEGDFEAFTAAGASQKVAKLLDRIAYVNRPDVQREQIKIAEDERYIAARKRETTGELGESLRVFGQGIREGFYDAAGAFLGPSRDRSESGGF